MIIDHVDNLALSDEELDQYANELGALEYLAVGLAFLNAQVQQLESEIRNRVGEDLQISAWGNAPQLEGIPQPLVACAFHWYSVTACNYVRLVGWLVNGGDAKRAQEYIKSVLPEVSIWRNKVGAHFARFSPRIGEDTRADLAMSVMFPIGFDDDAFYTNPVSLTLASGGQCSSSRIDMRWSLTHTHQQLSSRYWPSATTGLEKQETG